MQGEEHMSEYAEDDRLQDRLGANKMAYEIKVKYNNTKLRRRTVDKNTEEEALVAKCIDEVKSQYVDWYNLGYQTCMAEQEEWVGLTDEEIKAIIGHNHPEGVGSYARELFKQIEAKLKEKNT